MTTPRGGILEQFSLRARLSGILALAILVITVTTLIGLWSFSRTAAESMHKALRDVDAIGDVSIYFKSEVQAWKDTLIRGSDPATFEKYINELIAFSKKARTEIDSRRKDLTADENKLVDEFLKSQEILTDAYMETKDRYLKPPRSFDWKAADQQVKGKDRPVLESLNALSDLIQKRANSETEATLFSGIRMIVIIVFLAASILFILAWRSVTSLTSTIFATTREISGSTTEVGRVGHALNGISGTLSSVANETSSSVQETAASVNEINAMAGKNVENARSALAASTEAAELATSSKTAVDEMLQAIGEIETSNGAIAAATESNNKQLAEIVSVIQRIGEKTKVINDIVFQTKLLSFNASVEAARAGEQGKGFAVVAEEVGKLARMSGNAADEIAGMLAASTEKVEQIVAQTRGQMTGLINQSKAKVANGTEIANRCQAALDQISSAVGGLNQKTGEIVQASEEQAKGLDEINKAVTEIERAAEQTASSSEESTEAAKKLEHQAQILAAAVSTLLQTLEGGSASVGAASGLGFVPQRRTAQL